MIKYSKGYKYQLEEDFELMTPVTGHYIDDYYFRLYPNGRLWIRRGYAWDGASGPTFDSNSSMRPSLSHDVFCQLMRDGRLDYSVWQDRINAFFKEQCIDAGMWPLRASLWHAGVEFGDAGNPNQGPDRIVLTAP